MLSSSELNIPSEFFQITNAVQLGINIYYITLMYKLNFLMTDEMIVSVFTTTFLYYI